MKKFTQKLKTGFTLIEIMVVIAMVGILATVVAVNFSESSEGSRDAQRQADLRNLQQAIETYKNRHGRYPEQCAPNGGANGWSGQIGTDYQCADANEPFILGDPGDDRPFVPDFMAVLPTDPKLNGGNSGYVYTTNADGSVYKIMAMNTVEADELLLAGNVNAYTHSFKSCDMQTGIGAGGSATALPGFSLCTTVYQNDTDIFPTPHCTFGNSRYQQSYALWGGVAELATAVIPNEDLNFDVNERKSIRNTALIVCK